MNCENCDERMMPGRNHAGELVLSCIWCNRDELAPESLKLDALGPAAVRPFPGMERQARAGEA